MMRLKSGEIKIDFLILMKDDREQVHCLHINAQRSKVKEGVSESTRIFVDEILIQIFELAL